MSPNSNVTHEASGVNSISNNKARDGYRCFKVGLRLQLAERYEKADHQSDDRDHGHRLDPVDDDEHPDDLGPGDPEPGESVQLRTRSAGFGVRADGQRIATGSNVTTACIWDTPTGERLLVLHGHEQYVMAVA